MRTGTRTNMLSSAVSGQQERQLILLVNGQCEKVRVPGDRKLLSVVLFILYSRPPCTTVSEVRRGVRG